MRRILLLTLFVLFILNNTNIFGQICDRSKQPISFLYDSYKKPLTKEADISTKILGYINKDSLLLEDELNKDSTTGIKFGFVHKVQFNLNNSGTWDTLTNGDRLWRLRIVCPGAYSLTATNYRTYELNKENGKYQKGVRK
jgi:lysyl endopeptidase